MVITQANPSEGQNSIPLLMKIGNEMNKANEGRTNQKTPLLNCEIFSKSELSLYSQINAIIETKGNDARTAPSIPFFFANSLAPTTKAPEIIPRRTNCHQIIGWH